MDFFNVIAGRIICLEDPWEILSSSNDVRGVNGLELGGLIFTLRQAGIMFAFIMIALSILSIVWIQKDAKKVQEQKSNITHKLVILWLIGSIFFIFNTMKAFFDAGFGL